MKYIESNGLQSGQKLFDKPDKNIQKNLRKYLKNHV
jgi:hypothetical protein